MSDLSTDPVIEFGKDIPYRGYCIVGSALGYVRILDISNGRQMTGQTHILGSTVVFVDIVQRDDSCLLLAVNIEGMYVAVVC